MQRLTQTGAVLLSAAIALFTVTPPSRAERVTVPASTPVILKLSQDISSADKKKGDLVAMEVASDVHIGGKLVIAAGTPVQATVADASRRFIAGIGGYIKLTVQSVKAVDGSPVALKFEKQDVGESNMTSALLGIICCICILLIPGKDVKLAAGTLYNAVTLGPVELSTTPAK